MIKMRIGDDDRDQAVAARDYIAAVGEAILKDAPHMAEADRALLADCIPTLFRSFSDLEKVLAHVPERNPLVSMAILEIVTKLMLGSFIVGSSATLSTEAEQWRGVLKTHLMRTKKADKAKREGKDFDQQIAKIMATPTFKASNGKPISAESIFIELEEVFSISTIKRRLREIRDGHGADHS